MTAVDISEMSAALFIINVIFLLLVFGFLSFGVMSFFQQKFKRAWISVASAVVSAIVFAVILNVFFI